MTGPARSRRPTVLAPGMIAWASTWPDWEKTPGQESPHPILALGTNADGDVAILPCSTKGDLGRLQIPIHRDCEVIRPSAFTPHGPLEIQPTWICVADRQWRLNLRWVAVASGELVMNKGRIRLRKISVLAPVDWQRLQTHLAKAIHDTSKQQR